MRVSGRKERRPVSSASMSVKMDLISGMIEERWDSGGRRRERMTCRSRWSAGMGIPGRSRGWSVICQLVRIGNLAIGNRKRLLRLAI